MKILFGSFPAITVLGGGVERQTRSLAKVLKEQGVDVVLFNPWEKYKLADFDIFHLFGANVGTYHLGRAIKNLGMKLIVSPIFYSRHSPKRLKATLKLASILRLYGGFWTEHLFVNELCNMADLILTNTQEEYHLITRAFGVPDKKVGVVPNGVDREFFYATPNLFIEQFGIKDFVLYVGHIGLGRKNLLPLLQVIRKLGIPCVIIGKVLQNDYAAKCQQLIAQTPSIKLISELPPDSPLLVSAYAACDTFILPSLYETPGLAALEAGLAGAKICITDQGGTKEYFGNYVTYLNPRSESSIEQALRKTLAKPKTNALKHHIYSEFLWEKCGQKLIETYTHFLKRRASNSFNT